LKMHRGGEGGKAREVIKRFLPRAVEVVLLVIIVFCVAVLLTQDLDLVIHTIYSPLAIIFLVVVFVEYLFIKSGDRSRLYQIELERMREREEAYVARTRRALEEIHSTLERCRKALSAQEGEAAGAPSLAEMEEALRRIERILEPDFEQE